MEYVENAREELERMISEGGQLVTRDGTIIAAIPREFTMNKGWKFSLVIIPNTISREWVREINSLMEECPFNVA